MNSPAASVPPIPKLSHLSPSKLLPQVVEVLLLVSFGSGCHQPQPGVASNAGITLYGRVDETIMYDRFSESGNSLAVETGTGRSE